MTPGARNSSRCRQSPMAPPAIVVARCRAWLILLGAPYHWTRRLSDAPAQRHRKRVQQRLAASREARIRHEIIVRVEGFLPLSGNNSLARTVWQNSEALLVVHQIGLHDLIEDMFVNGRIEQRNQRLDASIEIARHEVGRRNECPSFR